ncbi:hypothetical protein DWY36_04550 [Firmicutes bacterium AF25-13AC]|jgi:hypothetical protein|nr:hypothetical protein DWY36_04550 [Firmicutes bacterium AF25-13AC]
MSIVHMQKQNIAEMLLKRLLKNKKMEVIKFLGENPGACPWDEAKKHFSKSLTSISSEYTLQI